MSTLTEKVRKPPQDARFQLYSVLDSIDDGVIIGDENHEIIFMNRSLREAFGDATGGLCYEFYGRSKPCPLCPIDHVTRRGEKRFRYTDVEKGRCFEITANPLKNPDGSTWVIEVIRDVKERKKAEEALRESEERLSQLIEYAPDAIYMNDLKGNFIDGNKQAEDLIGYKRDELIGKNFLKVGLLPKRYVPKAAKALMKNLLGQRTGPDEFELIRKDGRRVTVEISTFPVKRKGKVEVMGIARDITERKKMEEQLKEYTEHLEDKVEERTRQLQKITNEQAVLLSTVPAMIFWIDKEGNFIRVNEAFARALHKSPDDIKGKSLFDLYSQDMARRYYNDNLKVIKSGTPKRYIEETVETPVGIMWVSTDKIPYRDENGDIIGIIGFSVDVTERKRMEERILKAERLAAIGELAAMVGHDLRNPLQSITNAAYVMRIFYESLPTAVKESIVSEDAQKMLQIIQDEVTYANNIVSNLQDFARVREPEFQDTDLNSVIHDALSKVKIPGNIKVTARLDKTIPSLKIDPNQMTRVCSNLITNAVQAMPDGGKLTITSSRKGDFVEVEIQDTGVGIPKQNMEKLFTPLFTTKAKGVGLGLTICKNLVEAHGGSIEVESKVGKGSTVMIRVPIRRGEGR